MTPPVNLEEILLDGLPTRRQGGDAAGTYRRGEQS
jgi:hypothetical protein